MHTIFSTTKYNYDTLAERLRESAFLLKGLKIELIEEAREGNMKYIIMKMVLKRLLHI